MDPAAAEDTERRPVGRPPRINRDMIAEAAHEVGLAGLTLKAVADHLGVSIAALYHHVSGKDDLMRLAAEVSARKVPMPVDHGQHWAVWLLEWATYNRDSFLAEPELLGHYIDGAISEESIIQRVELIVDVLVQQGFKVADAVAAYQLVSSLGIGTAVGTIRLRQSGGGWNDLGAGDAAAAFVDRITTVLMGIAVRRGDDPLEVANIVAGRAVRRR